MGRVRDDVDSAISIGDPAMLRACMDDLRDDIDRSLTSALQVAIRCGRVWALREIKEWIETEMVRFTIAPRDRMIMIDQIHQRAGCVREELYAAAYGILYMYEADLDY